MWHNFLMGVVYLRVPFGMVQQQRWGQQIEHKKLLKRAGCRRTRWTLLGALSVVVNWVVKAAEEGDWSAVG